MQFAFANSNTPDAHCAKKALRQRMVWMQNST